MDNVLFGLGFLSLAGVIAFLVIAVVRILSCGSSRRNPARILSLPL